MNATKNVKLQVFVDAGFYINIRNLARKYELNYRSDSEMIQKLLIYYENREMEGQKHMQKVGENILRINKIIQEKEAALQLALQKIEELKKKKKGRK